MIRFLFVAFLYAMSFSATAQNVKGMWKGKMEIDSPKNTIHFEITLKEKQGKLYGYCYRLFFVNDTLYYNLVKVNARIVDSVLIIDDEKSVSNNFKFKTSGIKVSIFIKLKEEKEAITHMTGEWNTSRFKQFMPLSGSVSVIRERNYRASQLYKRLEDKGLDKTMAFEEPELNEPLIAKNETPLIPEVNNSIINQNEQTTIPTDERRKDQAAGTLPPVEQKEKTKPLGSNDQQVAVNNKKTETQPAQGTQKPTKESTQQSVAAVPNEAKGKENIKQQGPTNQQVVVNDKKTETQPVQGTQKPTQESTQQPVATVPNEAKGKENIKPQGPTNQQVVVNDKKTETQPSQGTQKPTQESTQQPVATVSNEAKGKENIKPQGTNDQQVAINDKKTETQPSQGTQKPTQEPTQQPVATVPIQEKGKEQGAPVSTSNPTVSVSENKTGTQPLNPKAGPEQQKVQEPTVNPSITNQEQPQQNITKIGQGQVTDSLRIQNTGAPGGGIPVINNPTITKRATEVIQSFTIYEDSITLSLYDNGEIDGDIVSVYMNNEKIISGVRLSETAYKKTIYFQPGQLIQLTLFAENLGSIPPNTGLLVIYSGDQRYQVHFSSTLNKSAVILLRTEDSPNP
jgi:hypothetical protein